MYGKAASIGQVPLCQSHSSSLSERSLTRLLMLKNVSSSSSSSSNAVSSGTCLGRVSKRPSFLVARRPEPSFVYTTEKPSWRQEMRSRTVVLHHRASWWYSLHLFCCRQRVVRVTNCALGAGTGPSGVAGTAEICLAWSRLGQVSPLRSSLRSATVYLTYYVVRTETSMRLRWHYQSVPPD